MSKSLMPPPPDPATSQGQKQDVFDEVVLWLLANYGLLAIGEQRGAGRVAPRGRTLQRRQHSPLSGQSYCPIESPTEREPRYPRSISG
jgi:hypothetical protein